MPLCWLADRRGRKAGLNWKLQISNTANNADITQAQAANHHRLLSHVTLGLIECMIAERYEPNPVLWDCTQFSHLVDICIVHLSDVISPLMLT